MDQETAIGLDNSSENEADELAPGFYDKKIVTTVNAQLQSMETYINPNVESALGKRTHNPDSFDCQSGSQAESFRRQEQSSYDQLLGVALIQPVTAGVEYCQIRRNRFPP